MNDTQLNLRQLAASYRLIRDASCNSDAHRLAAADTLADAVTAATDALDDWRTGLDGLRAELEVVQAERDALRGIIDRAIRGDR